METAGDPVVARALESLFRVDATLERALTHGFHSYAGRLHPSIARGAIARFAPPGGRVLDPFCGSGTVVVEAMACGRVGVGRDASPLALAIARVRSTTLGADGRARLVEAAAGIAEESGERARKRQRPDVPVWAEGEFRRFGPHVAFELLGLRELVMATPEDDLGRALRLCLSSLLVKFMRTGPAAPRDGEHKRIGRGIPSRFFSDRANELALGLEGLERKLPPGTPAPDFALGDARMLAGVPSKSVDLVLSSPPYAGTYDYAEQHEVRFRWLDLPSAGFLRAQLGERGHGLGVAPVQWREGRKRWMAELARSLRPGGYALLVVGDGVVGESAEDAATATEEAAVAAGLRPFARASQARPTFDRRLFNLFEGRPRREHLILLCAR